MYKDYVRLSSALNYSQYIETRSLAERVKTPGKWNIRQVLPGTLRLTKIGFCIFRPNAFLRNKLRSQNYSPSDCIGFQHLFFVDFQTSLPTLPPSGPNEMTPIIVTHALLSSFISNLNSSESLGPTESTLVDRIR